MRRISILLLAFSTCFTLAAWPQSPAWSKCSVALLEGTFGYSGQSFVVPNPSNAALLNLIGLYAPISLAGEISFDGKGNVTGVDSINLGDGGIPRTYAGTYQVVDPQASVKNCAFTTTFTDSLGLTHDLYMVLARQGQVLELVNTDPGVILSFSCERK